LLQRDREVPDAADARPLLLKSPPAVRFDQVQFAYDPDRPILHEVSFEIPAGQTVAVVGPSGSGKSTLARLLYRFYDVQGGRITVHGHDVRSLTQDSLRRHIGIVPQDTVLFNDTVAYNIAYGRPDASREEVEAAAKAAHIHDFIVGTPKGYDTVVGERGLKLSGGEKQRVAIARTLLKNPPVLVFDEATSALDSANERAIQAELAAVAQGKTVLIIAHRLSTIVHAHEILVMEHGRIIERGTHPQLLAAQGRYAEMWRLQQAGHAES
ncbi:MAG TPA: ATP-binding cassette domain-containing protein, partial [Aquabacterium sp.]|nr:ATP-binding cassette domain-containing protein [Aquabacterium sp.]